MDLLLAIERFGPVEAVKTSFVVYPLVNAAHVLAVGALLTSVILMDLRLLGMFRDIAAGPFVALLRRVALGSFMLAVATGIVLFSVRASEYGTMPLYWVKMGLILLAGLNFALFAAIDRQRPANAPLPAASQASVLLSLLLWPSILVVGRFLGFV